VTNIRKAWFLVVIPAEAGIQLYQRIIKSLDSGFHRSDDLLRDHQSLIHFFFSYYFIPQSAFRMRTFRVLPQAKPMNLVWFRAERSSSQAEGLTLLKARRADRSSFRSSLFPGHHGVGQGVVPGPFAGAERDPEKAEEEGNRG
jgi:hypothetical protein